MDIHIGVMSKMPCILNFICFQSRLQSCTLQQQPQVGNDCCGLHVSAHTRIISTSATYSLTRTVTNMSTAAFMLFFSLTYTCLLYILSLSLTHTYCGYHISFSARMHVCISLSHTHTHTLTLTHSHECCGFHIS
mmetsp:Transcript_26094/g.38354  ORF Transcript_26094/g.38354 Transcript_26094/m.38354 type:complete len:134 (-) Transcript_26094:380-781(-)